MNCPNCGSETELGRINIAAIGVGGDSYTVINWYPESEFGRHSMTSMFKKNGQTIADNCTSETEAWFCPNCKKVFASFDTK